MFRSISARGSLTTFGSNPKYELDVNNLVLGTSIFTGGKETELLTGTITSSSGVTSAVPEASTWVMMIIGLASLGLFGRRFGASRGVVTSA